MAKLSHIAPGEPDSAENRHRRLVERGAQELAHLTSKRLAGGLYVVATPIGNLGDITLRALATLAEADVIYCEDTRHSRTLLAHYGIRGPLRAYHEHNAARERPRIMAELGEGKRIALISDAGTPLVSDPGYKLVRDVIAAGFDVYALPGASAALAALATAGLPTDSFFFAGFLPPKQAGRRKRLREIESIPATLVIYEAPSRLASCLSDIAAEMGARDVAVARELTKLHEELKRGPAADLAKWAQEAGPKGEMVIIIGPPPPRDVSDEMIAERLADLLDDTSLRDAAKLVAEELSVTKRRVYDLGLAVKKNAGSQNNRHG